MQINLPSQTGPDNDPSLLQHAISLSTIFRVVVFGQDSHLALAIHQRSAVPNMGDGELHAVAQQRHGSRCPRLAHLLVRKTCYVVKTTSKELLVFDQLNE